MAQTNEATCGFIFEAVLLQDRGNKLKALVRNSSRVSVVQVTTIQDTLTNVRSQLSFSTLTVFNKTLNAHHNFSEIPLLHSCIMELVSQSKQFLPHDMEAIITAVSKNEYKFITRISMLSTYCSLNSSCFKFQYAMSRNKAQ